MIKKMQVNEYPVLYLYQIYFLLLLCRRIQVFLLA